MAFKLILAPELREKVDAEARELRRIYALQDRWLAAELLRLVRTVRSRTPYAAREPGNDTYNTTLLWDIIPEVAYRLGGKLELNESVNAELKQSNGVAFRNFVAVCMANVAVGYFRDADRGELLDPVSILFHLWVNGNPVVMALDRIVPPTEEATDLLANEMRSISERRGHKVTATWRPELQETPATEMSMAFFA